MVLVEYINIIAEEDKFVLFLQTKQGDYHQYVSKEFMEKFSTISKTTSDKFICCLLKKGQEATLYSKHNAEKNSHWEDILLQAVQTNTPIFLQEELLEFTPSQAHQDFVDGIHEELSNKTLEDKINLLMQAVADERFEEAALIRDEIDKLNEKTS